MQRLRESSGAGCGGSLRTSELRNGFTSSSGHVRTADGKRLINSL